MLLQSVARPNLNMPRQTSGKPEVPAGTFGEPLGSMLGPRYYPLVKAGKVFTMSQFGMNSGILSSYVSGNFAYPLFYLYNPMNSGVDLVLLSARIGAR